MGIKAVFTALTGVGFSAFILLYREKAGTHGRIVFINSGFISASFVYSQLYHSFDPAMKLFSVVVLGLIIAIGALIGGLVGILLPKISIGIELGLSIATLLGVLMYTVANISSKMLLGLFVVALGVSTWAAQRFEAAASTLRTCIVAGLILTLSIDSVMNFKMLALVSDVLGGDTIHHSMYAECSDACSGPPLAVLWALISGTAFARWAMTTGMLCGSRGSKGRGEIYNNYAPVSSGGFDHSLHQVAQGSVGGGSDEPRGGGKRSKTLKPQQRTFSYPDTLEFNYYDPDNMHDLLTPYADVVFTVVQSCAKLYGFQVDSSRNQAEHLIMMLTNETKVEDSRLNEPAHRLHMRMFSNYIKWCDRMGTPPLFSKPSSGKRYVGYIEDMLLFLLVWGEAGNLRHLPECMCFLFHKTLAEYDRRKENGGWRTTYPGYFLDMVVTPMYEEVVNGSKGSKDHQDKLNYDDFNEFFWNPDCLQYCIFDDQDKRNNQTGMEDGTVLHMDHDGNLVSDHSPVAEHVSRGMAQANKTYLEKRSWFHPMFAVHRVLEWHIVTFTILASLAFSEHLQWNWSFTIQVGSIVFIMISMMNILWTALEIWTQFPGTKITGAAIFGYLLRLLAGYLILVYQAIYYHWSFRPDGSPALGGESETIWSSHYDTRGNLVTGTDEGGNFWWWQYFWLSLFSCSLYIVQSFLCWCPSIMTSFMTWNNDYFQALLNICYPLSQHYIGKKVHVPNEEVKYYLLYWFTLLAWKLVFGYRFVIYSVTAPTVFLYDDYMNFPDNSFTKTCALMVMWWFPHFLVYIIDLSIWYSLWSSIVGAYVALVERQGAVRDSSTFRTHFMRSPVAFCHKVMPANSYVSVQGNLKRSLSTASITNIMKMAKKIKEGTAANIMPAYTKSPGVQRKKSKSSADLMNFDEEPSVDKKTRTDSQASAESLGTTAATATVKANIETEQSSKVPLRDFLDARSMRWVVFGRVWNEIIEKLRQTDHLSDEERDVFLFASFDSFMKPIYLPLYQTAGCVSAAIHKFCATAVEFNAEPDPVQKLLAAEEFVEGLDVTATEALSEVFELVSVILEKLWGPVHKKDIDIVLEILGNILYSEHEVFMKIDAGQVKPIMSSITQVVSTLKGCVRKRATTPVYNAEAYSAWEKEEEKNRMRRDRGSVTPPSGTGGKGIRKSVSTGFLHNYQSTLTQGRSGEVAAGEEAVDRFTKLTPFRKEIALVDQVRDKLRDLLRTLFSSIGKALKAVSDSFGEVQEAKDRITFMLSLENGFMWSDAYASKAIDDLAKTEGMSSCLFKCVGLLKLRQTEVDPKSREATRRMHFFINSLFMDMPSVPTTRYSREYTCMTPFYSEDVLLTKDDLLSKNSDGISTLLYLQTLYRGDWDNFVERRKLADDADGQEIWSEKHLLETRMWASYRAQTLFRTVEGMMYTEAALCLIAELEQIIPEETAVLTPLKFTYVVAAQVYGSQKKSMDTKADDIDFLLKRHPNLRVAYIDSVRKHRTNENTFYSVLIKHDPHAPSSHGGSVSNNNVAKANLAKGGYNGMRLNAKEVYRIKLPGNPVLGEGKPENQNHAIVFTRGRYVQAMDMNQDGYFEEALKMRNMLQEFDSGCTILGFREHIFTGSVSSVANYMACQELSFVTLGQRVLANPLRTRQHYGHPDFFDKLFVMTEGGMSKASKGINLSEDVFAGYNATIRGHSVRFKEYAQVGKGRDVGLQQTYKFEAKLSQGNAEQSISRDLSRLCNRLDFFRLFSFYYGGIGHYIANAMVIFALITVVYCMLMLALFDEEGINGRKMPVLGSLQLVLAGMGILQTAPLFVTLTVEQGLLSASAQICYMMISGGPLYFIFHIQTKAYYYCQTLLAGGAMYRPTGRGFVTRHSPFDENFRFFACSHLYLGFDLMCALVLLRIYSTSTQYVGLTWSLWMATASFIIGPFWFNPITFEWSKLSEDFVRWSNWMSEVGGSAEEAWETWWREENAFYNRLTVGWKIMQFCQKSVLWGGVAAGLLGTDFLYDTEGLQRVAELLGLVAAYGLLNWLLRKLQRVFTYALRRVLELSVTSAFFVALAYLVISYPVYIRYIVAMYYVMAASTFVLLLCGVQSVQTIYKAHDFVLGITIFLVLGVLSALQVGYLQTWLLYHNALSAGVAIEDVLKYARKTKERGTTSDTSEVVEQLRRQLAEQDKMLRTMMQHHALSDSSVPIASPATNYGAISGGNGAIELAEVPVQMQLPIDKPSNSPRATVDETVASGGSIKLTLQQPPSSSSPSVTEESSPALSVPALKMSNPRTNAGVGVVGIGAVAAPSIGKSPRVHPHAAAAAASKMIIEKDSSKGSNGSFREGRDRMGSSSSSDRLSNSSLASDSSFEASFNTEAKPAPADFSFSQPSTLPPRR